MKPVAITGEKDCKPTLTRGNLLVLILHHVSRVGLFDGLRKEFVQRWHELPGLKTSDLIIMIKIFNQKHGKVNKDIL